MEALGEAATHLAGLTPCAAALRALARAPAAVAWEEVRFDPGAVLLVVRQTVHAPASPAPSCFPDLLRDPAILEGALRLVGGSESAPPRFVDWNQPAVRPVYQAAVAYARLAYRLAEVSGAADPENAWVAGLLAPLGWLAVSAVDAERVAACLADPTLPEVPPITQQRHWGMDQAAIARRLARHWQLPGWLTATAGHLALPAETAQALGADSGLFRVVQLAVGWAEERGAGLHLQVGAAPAELTAALDLSSEDVQALRREADGLVRQAVFPCAWRSPESEPLLADLLALALETRRGRDAPALRQAEREIDRLEQALAEQRAAEAGRLRAQKLDALAEFAAGAGHEINNPLAVISGQAQYLLGHEPEPARQRALQTVIGQARRIHQVLNELMQFARPPRPQKQLIDLPALMQDVTAALREQAEQRRVRVHCTEPRQPVTLYADAVQVRTALACLVRNAIEAAPAEGWASLRLELPGPDRLEFVVEDSGPGPSSTQREHLFDPFYSGRLAGRGRGLGLPTAWRLAREHGGDVRFDPLPQGPTRFVLSLPREKDEALRPAA